MTSNNISLAIIGCGRWGKNFVKTCHNTKTSYCGYIVSKNPETKHFLTKNTQLLTNFNQLKYISDCDGAIIATPPETHFDIAMTLLDYKLPIIIEKPITTSSKTTKQIIEKALMTNVPIFVNHTHLFNPVFRQCCDWAAYYGPILSIKTVAGKWMPEQSTTDLLWELAPHDFAMCSVLATSPLTVKRCKATKKNNPNGVTLNIQLTSNNIQCDITLSNELPTKTRYVKIETKTHNILFQDYTTTPIQIISKKNSIIITKPFIKDNRLPLTCLVDEFSTAIQTNSISMKQLLLAQKVILLIEDCFKKQN